MKYILSLIVSMFISMSMAAMNTSEFPPFYAKWFKVFNNASNAKKTTNQAPQGVTHTHDEYHYDQNRTLSVDVFLPSDTSAAQRDFAQSVIAEFLAMKQVSGAE